MMSHLTKLVRHLRERRAIAAVEFALVSPILIVLLMFVIDFGTYLYTSLRLSNAVTAGADYALIYGQSVNANSSTCASATPACLTVSTYRSNISTIVRNASSPVLSAPTVYYNTSSSSGADTDTVFNSCYCPSSTASPSAQTTSTCGTACADGSQPGSYVAIVASATYSTFFPGDSWLSGGTINKTTWVRVQ
jgi:Flp pilus assembly protein TadG